MALGNHSVSMNFFINVKLQILFLGNHKAKKVSFMFPKSLSTTRHPDTHQQGSQMCPRDRSVSSKSPQGQGVKDQSIACDPIFKDEGLQEDILCSFDDSVFLHLPVNPWTLE